jgi:hypothetical protein
LHAALRALDERGALRIERHKTHGEYVRECKDPNAKRPLRELVREVDRVKWGGARVDTEAVSRAKERSLALVRAILITLALALVTGCGTMAKFAREADPSEDGLFLDLLKRQGAEISRLHGSLATMPLPKEGEVAPVVVVDAERVALSDDTRAHLVRWVEAGGVLVLAGDAEHWPKELDAKPAHATSRLARVHDLRDAKVEDEAHLARPSALDWPYTESNTIARLEDGTAYAVLHHHGDGVVLGVANDDLFTNAGLARAGNARALVRILSNLRRNAFQIARPEDGITPPASPIAALVDAGLGKGLLHAAFAVLLTFVAYGARQGRPRPTPRPARRAFAEHVQATGALYARTGLGAYALAAYARYADARVRAQMPRGVLDPATFLAQRTGEDPARVADLWARATAAAQGQFAGPTPLLTLKELSRLVSAAVRR